MKRSMDAPYGQNKRPRQEAIGPELRLLIPSKVAGALIGKGGENVKRLRSEYHADISIPDSITPERILYIIAPDCNLILDIVSETINKMEEVNAASKSGGRDPELKMLVHQSQAGGIIGRGGTKIKELREQTGTAIKVFGECCPRSTDRVVVIAGENQKIVHAVREVMTLVAEIPEKGSIKNYDTSNYNPDFSEEYGGYPPDRNYMRNAATGPGRFGMGGGPPMGGIGSYSRGGGGMGMGGQGGGGGGGRFGGGQGGGFDDDFMPSGRDYMSARGGTFEDQGGEPITQQVTIPRDLAGSIIGKGGDRITRIRDECGAKIVMREPDGESNERIISITGTKSRVDYAQFLLQQCVRASAAGRRYIQEASR